MWDGSSIHLWITTFVAAAGLVLSILNYARQVSNDKKALRFAIGVIEHTLGMDGAIVDRVAIITIANISRRPMTIVTAGFIDSNRQKCFAFLRAANSRGAKPTELGEGQTLSVRVKLADVAKTVTQERKKRRRYRIKLFFAIDAAGDVFRQVVPDNLHREIDACIAELKSGEHLR